jgi:hypothetical protein
VYLPLVDAADPIWHTDAMRVYAHALLVLLAIAQVAQVADGAVLCRKRSGAVVLRDKCARRELPIDPLTLGLQGPTGAQGPPGVAALVKDTAGTLVGHWFVLPGSLPAGESGVLRTLGSTIAFLRADTSGFVFSGSFYFESADCSGTPYMLSTPGALVTTAAVGSGTAYLPSGAPTMRLIASFAQLMSADACAGALGTFVAPDRCCIASVGTYDLVTVEAVDLNALGLVPPFRIELP